MEHRPDMRASDADRQEVVDRLRGALDEGRLKMDEYLERMSHAYQAATYGDLAPLYADLPETRPVAKPEPAPAAPAPAAPVPPPQREAARRGGYASLPAPLKVLWTVWGTVVAINVVVWVLVSATAAHVIYPWPLWVAGPWGVVLLGLSAGAAQLRRHRPPPATGQLPSGEE
jgi:Domain of unknown function (DUF1707)